MSKRLRHDCAFAAVPIFLRPLIDLLDDWEVGQIRAYYYETLMATLEAYEVQCDRVRKRLSPEANEHRQTERTNKHWGSNDA